MTESALDDVGRLTHQVTELTDRNEIANLVYRLGVSLDEGRFDDMRELLIEDATVRTPGGKADGRDALVAQAQRNHPPDQRFQHVTTNVMVDLDGDRAKARANLLVHITTPDDALTDAPAPPPRATLGEVYSFEFVRTPDGWRFSRIETVPLWLSGTLPPVRPPDPRAPASRRLTVKETATMAFSITRLEGEVMNVKPSTSRAHGGRWGTSRARVGQRSTRTSRCCAHGHNAALASRGCGPTGI